MKKLSAKNKIIASIIAWLLGSALMIMYGFNIFSQSNQKMIFSIEESKKELAALQTEKNSYAQAQKDLDEMNKEKLQPEDFFSKDTTLVNELKILESLQDSLGVSLTVSGVSGTSKSATKAKTQSDIVTVPYSISAYGPFENVMKLMNTMENLPFVTSINSISLSVGDKDRVNLSMSANFYIRRN